MQPDRVSNVEVDSLRDRYERRIERERRARGEAEDLLEAKSLELYSINQQLKHLAAELEQRVSDRTQDLALAERKALSLAERDQLTGIANRMVFARMSEASIAMATAKRGGFAMLLIDLDNFKHINDGFGHDVGDALLCASAERIVRATRKPDCVARLGGDEFAALISDCVCPSELAAIALRIISTVREPVSYRGHVIEASCSVGIAVFPDNATDAAELQRFADLALYKAKGSGRATYAIFDEQLRRDYDDRHALGGDLKLAIERGEVEPWFQPIVNAGTSRLVGIEALARWRHRTRGLLPPSTFLPLAEERGLMSELFAAMLRMACRRSLPWIEEGLVQSISVNVSPHQFRCGRLAEVVKGIVEAEHFPAKALTIEITEEVLLKDLGFAGAQLEHIARSGVRIALDDFGVGYSNLGYLRRLPIHQLKLDRVLTMDVAEDHKARSILGAIIAIARTLELEVVAEGVETPQQAKWLGHLGCDKLQGFYHGRPMDGARFQATYGQTCCGTAPAN